MKCDRAISIEMDVGTQAAETVEFAPASAGGKGQEEGGFMSQEVNRNGSQGLIRRSE